MDKKERIVIIGTGLVGMSYAYCLLNQGLGDEIVLIDINEAKARGEALDLAHGMSFAKKKMLVISGDYSDCNSASIVVITAGANQNVGESRLELLKKNAGVMKSIVTQIKKTSFGGVIIVATNPVDVLANIVYLESGYPHHRVIGSGTLLDTARLRYEISKKLMIDSRVVHAYILGEHGDSEFMCFSNAYVSVKPLIELIQDNSIQIEDVEQIVASVKNAAYEIIGLKGATCYAIGMALTRLTNALLDDERTILPISTFIKDEYRDICNTYVSVPAVVGHNGVVDIVKLNLSHGEEEMLINSANIIKKNVLLALNKDLKN